MTSRYILDLIVATLLGAPSCGDASSTGRPCKTNAECGSGFACVYEIEQGCSAEPTCQAVPGGPTCGAIQEFCGCSGEPVFSGCGFPYGYATGAVRSSDPSPCTTPRIGDASAVDAQP